MPLNTFLIFSLILVKLFNIYLIYSLVFNYFYKMTSIGAEVGQKMRVRSKFSLIFQSWGYIRLCFPFQSAIKAKLLELNCYVGKRFSIEKCSLEDLTLYFRWRIARLCDGDGGQQTYKITNEGGFTVVFNHQNRCFCGLATYCVEEIKGGDRYESRWAAFINGLRMRPVYSQFSP